MVIFIEEIYFEEEFGGVWSTWREEYSKYKEHQKRGRKIDMQKRVLGQVKRARLEVKAEMKDGIECNSLQVKKMLLNVLRWLLHLTIGLSILI